MARTAVVATDYRRRGGLPREDTVLNPSQSSPPVPLPKEREALADDPPPFLASAGEDVGASVGWNDPTRQDKPRGWWTGYALVLLAMALVLLSRTTRADANSSALVALTSNYVYRGYSKSNGAPVLQGNLDYEHSSGFFLGTWVSQIDFGHERYQGRANFEANPYVGGSLGLFGDWKLGTTLAGYLYDGKVYGHTADYGEISGMLYFRDVLTARVGVSYEAYGRGRSPLNYEINLRYPVMATVEVSSGLGYEEANAVLTYSRLYGYIGAGWFPDKHAALALRYYNAQRLNELKGGAEDTRFKPPKINHHVVFSISIGF